MDASTFLLHLVLILVFARVFAELAARLGIPPVLGEVGAGVILGPSLLGWVEPTAMVSMLAEVGIILLLFRVGLETDVHDLLRTGWRALGIAALGFVLPLAFGFSLGFWVLGLGLMPALFVGGTLTATSIGITVRVLSDLGRHKATEGQIVVGAAVLDDIFGVILLAMLYEFSTEGAVSLVHAGKVFAFVLTFFLLATPAAKAMSFLIERFAGVSEVPGLIPTAIVALVLFFAWISHLVGAPELLGGFAAGLALSRRFFLPFGVAIRTKPGFALKIHAHMVPIVQLFTPIFFVTVGLSVDLTAVNWSVPFIWTFTAAVFVVAVAGKMLGPLLIGGTNHMRWAVGLAMVPRGEVGLIFAELARAGGVVAADVYAGLVMVIVLTTLLAPLAMKVFYARYGPDMPRDPAP